MLPAHVKRALLKSEALADQDQAAIDKLILEMIADGSYVEIRKLLSEGTPKQVLNALRGPNNWLLQMMCSLTCNGMRASLMRLARKDDEGT